MSNEIYYIRNYKESDKAFVMATFLRGLYYGNEFFNMIPKNEFMQYYKQVVEALISKNNIHLACLTDDPDVLIGYVILSTDAENVHWIYIKSAFRRQGISKALLPVIPKNATHFTDSGLALIKKYKVTFNPFNL